MRPELSSPTREQGLASVGAQQLDLLVIGGGIVGAGIARDAAMRGLRTALVDRGDFASGTSSKSSRLLHGGLRYLAQGRLGLVRVSSVEKRIIHDIAPHLAQPLPFVFPTYRHNRNWVLWQLKIGVKVYDLLCGGRNFGASSSLSPAEVRKSLPDLNGQDLTGGVRYFDGFTNDARLTIDTLRSAANHGASVLNYCEYKDAVPGSTWKCLVEDVLTGKDLAVQARAVVNATGPWGDTLPQSSLHLRRTKGVHLVLNRNRLAVDETAVLTDRKRILFAIPWGERVILGTTDTDYSGPLDTIITEPEDVNYILEVVNRFFPSARLTVKDVLSSWAGVRPLIATTGSRNGTSGPSDISRSHQISMPQRAWWDVAGGKLTTYRLMAEQTLDRIVKELNLAGEVKPCTTASQPLLPAEDTQFSGILPPPLSRAAVEHLCRREWAVHLQDVLVRRTSWHYYNLNAWSSACQVADWMAEELGWDGNRKEKELAILRLNRTAVYS